MKNLFHYLVLSVCCAAAVQAVTTSPVGLNTIKIPAGSLANPSFTTFSFPLSNIAEFTGTISSVDNATQVTLNGATWTENQFVSDSAPRLARIMSGTSVGRLFLVVGNTTNQLTLDFSNTLTITDLNLAVAVGDSIQIVPANTLATLFGTTPSSTPAVQFLTGASAAQADNLWILSRQTWETYYHNGTNWRRSGSLTNQNNTIIYPDEGVLVAHIDPAVLYLTFTGTVPLTNQKTDISGTGSTFLANRFPVDTQLVNLGIHSLPGWLTGASASAADNVWAWNPVKAPTPGWDIYYYNGTIWKKSGSLANQNTATIAAGTALIIIKNGSSSSATLDQVLPYPLDQ